MGKRIQSTADCGVYKVTCTANGRVYIGSSKCVARRLYLHRWQLGRGDHHSKLMQRAWHKYGSQAFTFELVLICAEGDLLFYEQALMDFYQSYDPLIGMNISSVAGRACVPFTEERRAAARDARLGKPIFKNNPEAHANMMAAVRRGEDHSFFGRTHTAESKEKISVALKGRGAWNKGLESSRKGMPRAPLVRAKIAAAKRAGANTKLSMDKAKEIRIAYAAGQITQKQLAEKYEVSGYAISAVILNKSWTEEGCLNG